MGIQINRFSPSIRQVVFIAFFLVFSAPVNSKTYEEALTLYHQGDFQKSYSELLLLASQNNPKAFYLLGKMHERGDGVPQSENKAINFYRSAGNLGFSGAEDRIKGLENNESSVVLDWYLESALDGDVASEFNLGYLYEMGMGVRIDESKAMQWYEEAANQQHADAQFRLGLMLIAGANVERDLVVGKQWMIAAASNGNKVAKAINERFRSNNSDLKMTRIVQGLRTLESDNSEFMMQILSSSFSQVVKVKKPDRLVESKVVSINSLEKLEAISRAASSEPRTLTFLNPVEVADEAENDVNQPASIVASTNDNISMFTWGVLYFIVVGLVLFAMRKKLLSNFYDSLLQWMGVRQKKELELPQFGVEKTVITNPSIQWPKIETSEKPKDLAVGMQSINMNSDDLDAQILEALNQAAENQEAKEGRFMEGELGSVIGNSSNQNIAHKNNDVVIESEAEISESPELPSYRKVSESFIARNNAKIDASAFHQLDVNQIMVLPKVRVIEKVSFSTLLPDAIADIQTVKLLGNMNSDANSCDYKNSQFKTSIAIAQSSAKKVARQSRLQQKIIRSLVQEKTKKSYVSEQVREYEASRVNDVNVVSEARFNIGMMFFRGEGVVKNIQLAIKWFERSAQQDGLKAKAILSQLYLDYPEYEMTTLGAENHYSNQQLSG